MSKSDKTYELEEVIALATWKVGRIGCQEVGLGDEGIVDYISIELGGARVIRCYELKISKSDFLSDNKKTFIGDFNYYVIPTGLWNYVRGYVEPGIGVWAVSSDGTAKVMRKATRMPCKLDRRYVTVRIVHALYRENIKAKEAAWRARQEGRGARDADNMCVNVGDRVTDAGRTYVVSGIDFVRKGTRLAPMLELDDGSGVTRKVPTRQCHLVYSPGETRS